MTIERSVVSKAYSTLQKLRRKFFPWLPIPKLLRNLAYQQSYDTNHEPEIWLDVGAHLGETTFEHAQRKLWLTVYAFEPNLHLAIQRIGKLKNYVVIPMAVSAHDGFANFHVNVNDETSSLFDFSADVLQKWRGGGELKTKTTIIVPTIRLDTFLTYVNLSHVNYLKIDVQGADFDVILSLGDRIQDVNKIKLEVAITPTPLYEGARSRIEIVNYLTSKGFELVDTEEQSYGQEENLTFILGHAER